MVRLEHPSSTATPTGFVIDLTRSPSPAPRTSSHHISPPSSPHHVIPSVFQQLRSRNLPRLNSFKHRPKAKSTLNSNPPIPPFHLDHPRPHPPASSTCRLTHLIDRSWLPDPITHPGRTQKVRVSNPHQVSRRPEKYIKDFNTFPGDPSAPSTAAPPPPTSILNNSSSPNPHEQHSPIQACTLIRPVCSPEEIDSTADRPSLDQSERPTSFLSLVARTPAPICDHSLAANPDGHQSSSPPSESDAQLVESLLLGRTPLKLNSSSQQSSDLLKSGDQQLETRSPGGTALESTPPISPPPRFLPSDLKCLNFYLCRPISRALTTCSSIIIPPQTIPGLPLDSLDQHYSQDKWRIKRELITSPTVPQKVDCWIYGDGWPAKSFIICGWLVGIDRREKYLIYYIDDGTAVLECQIPISQLLHVFETLPTDWRASDDGEKHIESSKSQTGSLPEAADASRDSAQQTSRLGRKPDPRLDPYRRLPSPERRLKAVPSNPTSKNYPKLPTTSVNTSRMEINNADENSITEEVISKYSSLRIGLTLRLMGQPRELFRNTKRVLDVEKVIIIQGNGYDEVQEEIKFRNQLNQLRSQVYNQPFRLSNVWPEGLNLSDQNHHTRVQLSDRPRQVENQTGLPETKKTRRLKLPPVSKLKLEHITFSNFLNYLSHCIMNRYDEDHSEESDNHHKISYHELKGKIDRFEKVECPEFSIEEILQDNSELEKFMERLNQKEDEQKQSSSYAQDLIIDDSSKPNPNKRSRSIFLTDDDGPNTRGKRQRLVTRRGLINRSTQALLGQGTIIISPLNEGAFTIPNVYSLGVKIIQIINDHYLQPTASNHSTHPKIDRRNSKAKSQNCYLSNKDGQSLFISLSFILSRLTSDLLWHSISKFRVIEIFNRFKFIQIDNDSWSISRSNHPSNL